jgi:hypothetical protein
MSFFQNVFDFEFRPTIIGADRQYQTGWKLKANANRSDYMTNYQVEPYNLTGNNVFTINFAYDPTLLAYASHAVTLSGANIAAVTALEVVNSLNADSMFSSFFTAKLFGTAGSPNKILITSKKSKGGFRAYISNTSAETVLQFNRNAPITELPTYFEKYAIENKNSNPDLGPDRVVLLDPAVSYEASLISWAGLDPTSPKADWELLAGSSDAYMFYKNSYDGSNRLVEEIKYPAGATAGFLAKKTTYKYTGASTVPSQKCEIPYVLVTGDLLTP